jgi:hypothetical protein
MKVNRLRVTHRVYERSESAIAYRGNCLTIKVTNKAIVLYQTGSC